LDYRKFIADDEEIATPDISLTEILQGIRDEQEYSDVKMSLLTVPILSYLTQFV
jgi:predicted nucleic acid-binding protein